MPERIEIRRAKAPDQYDSHEEWGADVDRQVKETLENAGWDREELDAKGPDTVEAELAKMSIFLVYAE